VERLIGSIRRECLDHIIVANARGLRRALGAYTDYYLQSRTHLALGKDTPVSRPIARPADGAIMSIPHVGGLHHRYERRAALGTLRPLPYILHHRRTTIALRASTEPFRRMSSTYAGRAGLNFRDGTRWPTPGGPTPPIDFSVMTRGADSVRATREAGDSRLAAHGPAIHAVGCPTDPRARLSGVEYFRPQSCSIRARVRFL